MPGGGQGDRRRQHRRRGRVQDPDRAREVARRLVDRLHIRADCHDRAHRASAEFRDAAFAFLGQVEGLGRGVDVVAVDEGPAVRFPRAAQRGFEAQGRVGQVHADHDEHARGQHHDRLDRTVSGRAGTDERHAADHRAPPAEGGQRGPHVFRDACGLLPETDQSHRNSPVESAAFPVHHASVPSRRNRAPRLRVGVAHRNGSSAATCGVRVAKRHGWGAECATQVGNCRGGYATCAGFERS